VPAILIAIVAAPYILRIFGAAYATGSTTIFQLLAVSTVFVSVSSVCNTILNIEHKTSGIIVARVVTFLTTMGAVFPLMRFGLPGIGVAMLLGYGASNIAYIFIFKFKRPEAQTVEPITLSQ
jgi:O-antigen/teichoic acid export membrane protein